MLHPSNNVSHLVHNVLARTNWALWLHPKPEEQSNNVLGVGKAGNIWQIVLVTTADNKSAKRPGKNANNFC